MLGFVTKATSGLARTSAHRPIHVIILTALLASIAYLSVVDEYIPKSISNGESISFYHRPGSDAYGEWERIDDSRSYSQADSVVIVPLVFKRMYNNNIPVIKNTYSGINNNERILISKPEDLDETLQYIEKISYNGISWKVRQNNRLFKSYEYLRTGFLRIKSAIQGAERFDIALIVAAYIAMWYTLIKVFIDMKSAGSNFWLAFSTITSSTLGFLFALVVSSKFLNCKVPLMSLTEGVPFLVAIIGFKHKISIATLVMHASTSNSEVRTIVSNVISEHSLSLLRDHIVVIGALLACASYAPHLEGLKNFCILGSLILAFDLLLVYTFYSSILALKVEINRARRSEDLKEALEEEGISSLVAQSVTMDASRKEPFNTIFKNKGESILSFKVAMVAAFLSFHVFWMGSSWLYNVTSIDPSNIFTESPNLSKQAAKHINIGSNGTVVMVLAPRIYMPLSVLIKVEDFIVLIFEKVSFAIRDKIISKVLFFGFIVSTSINAYFLNSSRFHRSAANKLIQKEMARPTSSSKKAVNGTLSSNSTLSSASLAAKLENTKEYASGESDSSGVDLEIKASNKVLPLEECVKYLKDGIVKELNDEEVSLLVESNKLPLYALEKQLQDNTRAVAVRRKAIARIANAPVVDSVNLPYKYYDYDRVFGACCENVIGFIPLPVGVAGPLIIDGVPYHIPLATTEGCLVASTMRGCKAMNAGGGVQTVLTQDGMTRGPCVSFPTLKRAGAAKIWLDSEDGQKTIKKAFNSTSRFARLQHIQTAMAGTLLFIRFKTTTGDAMGMNMISKGVEFALQHMVGECGWEDMEIISLSGNYCIDKKPAAINWIEGRGKSVVAEARIPKEFVKKVLKSDVDALVQLNISKNLVGSAMAGSVGGFNAHAANLVTAIYLACGQDPAQNVESSNCITLMNNIDGDLQISVSMPSIEVGTIGGGTVLEPQGAMLELLGVRGPHPTNPGDNARQLARIIASAVLAAELSLCSALAAGHLVQSHMQHNRKGGAPSAAENKAGSVSNGSSDPKHGNEKDIDRLKEGSVNCIPS